MSEPPPPSPSASSDDVLRELLERWYAAEEAGEAQDPDLLRGVDSELVRRFGRIVGRSFTLTSTLVRKSDPNHGPPPLPAERIGPFRLIREIGVGGSSRVYSAVEEGLGRRVAIKLFHHDSSADSSAGVRFRREAEIMAALEHPNIVPVYRVGQEGPWSYIAMKLLSGPSWAELGTPLDPHTAARMGASVARALHEAHSCGVLHRDVKPSNIVLDLDRALLLDFGLALKVGSHTLTQADVVPGTLLYMSPEQLEARGPLDPRTDVYSLGAALYEAVEGKPPFDPSRPKNDLLRDILLRDPPPMIAIPRASDFRTIVQRAMEKDCRHRYSSAKDLADDLERFVDGHPILARRRGPVSRAIRLANRHRRVVAFTALLVLLVALTLAALWAEKRSAAQERERRTREAVAVIDTLLANDRLDRAEDLMRALDARGVGPDLDSRRRDVAARRSLERLLDAIQDLRIALEPDRIRALLTSMNAVPNATLPQPMADLARVMTMILLKDANAVSALDQIDARHGVHRASAALRQLIQSPTVPLVTATLPDAATERTSAVVEHLFVVHALRASAAALSEQRREIELAWRVDPGHPRVRFSRARLSQEAGDLKSALASFENLVEDGRHRPRTLYAIARVHMELGDTQSARDWFDRAPEDPTDVSRATILLDLLRLEGSPTFRDVLRDCARRWPRSSDFHRFLAQDARREGNLTEAKFHIAKAIEYAMTPDGAALARLRALEFQIDTQPPETTQADLTEQLDEILECTTTPVVEAEAWYLLSFVADSSDARLEAASTAATLNPYSGRILYNHAYTIYKRYTLVLGNPPDRALIDEKTRLMALAGLASAELVLATPFRGPSPPTPQQVDQALLIAAYLASAHAEFAKFERALDRFFASSTSLSEQLTSFLESFAKTHPDYPR